MLQTPTLNLAALDALADHFERLHWLDYQQDHYAYCIAGHCNRHIRGKDPSLLPDGGLPEAASFLGLDEDQARRLFSATPDGLLHPLPHTAARTIRRLAATGEVDWKRDQSAQ